VYRYPDVKIERPVFNPCFSACAKNNRPEDCCTGEYNSPTKCQPSDYSKSVKAVCPDAYSFGKFLSPIRLQRYKIDPAPAAFDDQTSTFIIPSGAGFEVVFCPGGRSTNILATHSEEMRQLAQSGRVSEDMGSQTTMSKRKDPETFPNNWAMRQIRLDGSALAVTFLAIACSLGLPSIA
jgi:hypothetical protein